MARDYLKGRGLNEEVCREFRLGLALGGDRLARKALEKGFTHEELAPPASMRQRGDDYFAAATVVPARRCARAVCSGSRRGKLHEDDPLPPKYVNTPESELFRKGAVVYGLDKARAAIAREDRACVVEGNTDVIALRQAGFEPVVARMGTALTEQQLKELGRLTRRLWLAFDGDAAGETATLRGMELAVEAGVRRQGRRARARRRSGRRPEGFEQRLASAEPYLLYRVRIEIDRADDREVRSARCNLLDEATDSPERQDAWRYANDKLGMTVQLRAGRASARAAAPPSQRVLDASAKLERNALAGVLAHDALRAVLAELTPEHFYDEAPSSARPHRRRRAARRRRSGCWRSSMLARRRGDRRATREPS